jgi:hypothetical protein
MMVLAVSASVSAGTIDAQEAKSPRTNFPLDSVSGLELINARAEAATYRGRRALHLLPAAGKENSDENSLALLDGSDFKDGTIEVDLAGAPHPGAAPGMRGFIGIAFRVQGKDAARYECIYLRPTNGRADDQLRRNHSTQYISFPDYSWERLRKETPGVYESYVDLEAAAWTKIKIVVKGGKASLYINGAGQPCLIVNDLKLGETKGQIALWGHSSSDTYFANLNVK